jgi:hypothetical protein
MYVIAGDGRLVDRYDKRVLSHTGVTRFHAPGFELVVFEVDGFRFGLAVCVEINFPHLFTEYEQPGVDCLLVPAHPIDSILATKARAYAAIHDVWVAVSIPCILGHLRLHLLHHSAGEGNTPHWAGSPGGCGTASVRSADSRRLCLRARLERGQSEDEVVR